MDGLDQLAKLLAFVKRDGLDNAFLRDSHYGGDVENVNFRPYPEPLRSLRHSLEESKLCMAALDNIKTRLAKKIRNLQKRCKPLVLEDGVRRIPDEILASVFEAGHHTSEYYPFALLSSRYPPDQMESFISRSGHMGLQVELLGNPVDQLISSLQLMVPHSDRWSRMTLTASSGDNRDIIAFLGFTSFPRLQYISHHDMYIEPDISQWNMPLLTHLDGWCSQFAPVASFPFLHQLTNVHLFFNEDDCFDMKSFADILYKLVGLRNLSLEFRECEMERSEGAVLETPKPHSFPIDSLKVTIKNSVHFDLIYSLYTILTYLTTSVVDISMPDPLHFLGTFPHGDTIRLQIGLPCRLSIVIDQMLKHCENLRSLQFTKSSFIDDTYIWLKRPILTSLRHLRFHDCTILGEAHVRPMARGLLKCADFQSLEFVSCHKLTEEFLLYLQDEVGERLTWTL